jgi:hypothetical protein
MKKLYLLLSSIALGCSFSSTAQVNLTATVGTTTGSYTNLTDAFAAINTGTHGGDIDIEITANISEGIGVATLNPSTVLAPYDSVTIRPGADNIVVDGGGLTVIRLKGADNVTIDGDNPNSPGVNRNLTITNTSLGGGQTCLWISSTTSGTPNGAINNKVLNCIIEGVDKIETSYGIITGGNNGIGLPTDITPNNNNTISNNHIRRCRDGIAVVGGPTSDNGWVISNNRIGDDNILDGLAYRGISASNTINISITDNVIAGIQGDITSVVSAINLSGLIGNATISRNAIHNIDNTESTTGYGSAGIYFLSNGSAGNVIYNNDIWGIGSWGNVTGFTEDNNRYGIVLAEGSEFDVYYNTVYMTLDPEGPDGKSAALYIGSAIDNSAIDLKNNIFYNEATIGENYAIYSEDWPAVFTDIDYNMYYNAGPNLSYLNIGVVPDIAGWRALTTRDTGSVSGAMAWVINSHWAEVNSNDSTCWFVNGRGISSTVYNLDINGNARNTVAGFPTDIGSREFSPAPGVEPPMAIASAAPANSTTTTYSSAGRKIAEITWGAAGTVPTDVFVQYYSGEEPPNPPTARIHSYWDIAEQGGSGYDFELKLSFTKAENRGNADASLNIIRDSSGQWRDAGGAILPYEADGRPVGPSNVLTVLGLFSLGNNPLSLDLLSFSGRKNQGINELSWTTASERDMSHFEVMRSADGINFSTIGKVTCKNDFMKNEYSFRDAQAPDGYSYYKLKIEEITGYTSYSNVVALKNGGDKSLDITSVYPNPTIDRVHIDVLSSKASRLKIEITDISGKTLISQEQDIAEGSSSVLLSTGTLASGMYAIKASLADGTEVISKLLKQ